MADAQATPLDTVTLGGSKYTISRAADGHLIATPVTTDTPTPTDPPATTPVTIDLKATADGATGAKLTWNADLKSAVYGRDGKDSTGYGAWNSDPGATSPATLTSLVTGATYKFTVSGMLAGKASSESVSFTVAGGSTPPATTPPTTTPPATDPPTPVPSTGSWKKSAFPTAGPNVGWLSGASGETVANGVHGTWRGTPDDIATTWVSMDSPDGTLRGEYKDWTGSLVVSLGLVASSGEWASAATGADDAKWEAALRKVQAAWDANPNRKGILVYSPAWEFNGSWFAHHTDPKNPEAMSNALKRFRAVQKKVSPDAKVMLTANRDTSGLSFDWRKAIPGYNDAGDKAVNVPKYIDALGVDYYNGWSAASKSQAEFDAASTKTDGYGAPLGIEAHRLNAKLCGVPLGVPEWSGIASGNGSTGDEPTFPVAMHGFFKKNAGTGAGNVALEVNFAVAQTESGKFLFGPSSQMPNASAAYKDAF